MIEKESAGKASLTSLSAPWHCLRKIKSHIVETYSTYTVHTIHSTDELRLPFSLRPLALFSYPPPRLLLVVNIAAITRISDYRNL